MARSTRIQLSNNAWSIVIETLKEFGFEKHNSDCIAIAKKIEDETNKSANDVKRGSHAFAGDNTFASRLGMANTGNGELLLHKLKSGHSMDYDETQSLMEYLIVNDKLTPELQAMWEPVDNAAFMRKSIELKTIQNNIPKLGA